MAEFPLQDAAADDWPSERLAERLQAELDALLQQAFDAQAAVARLSTAFRGAGELVPKAAERTERAGWTFERSRALDVEPRASADFPVQWKELFAALEPRETPQRHLALVRVDGPTAASGAPATAACEAWIELVQRRAGRSLQLRWELSWDLSGETPRLSSLRPLAWALARGKPLYVDVAGRAFGANPCWPPEFLRGVFDTYERLDRQAGAAFQGMQGLAVGDVDGDGLEDVYVPQQVGLPNRLFRHQLDGTAQDVSAAARVQFLDVTRAALLIDVDNDGDLDLAAGVANSLLVRFNDGKGHFAPEGQQWLVAKGAEQFYSLAAADPDRDGDLDIFACRYSLGGVMHGAPRPYHDAMNGAPNVYWRNEGGKAFVDGTADAGFDAENSRFTLAALWEDLNGDGHLDLYVVNDFGRNQAYVNDGQGRFAPQSAELGVEDIGAGMGAASGDFDLDGDLDLYVTNMFSAPGLRAARRAERWMGGRHEQVRGAYVKHASGNSLLRRDGARFTDVTQASATGMGRWAWGAVFTEFDGDGWPDLIVPNGQTTNPAQPKDAEGYFWRRVVSQSPADDSESQAYRDAFDAIQELVMHQGLSWNGNERNVAYWNLGDGTFADVSAVSGLDFADDARCAATLDWDGDLCEDLLLKNRSAPRLRLLLNKSPLRGARIGLELTGKSSNRDAIGALVSVTAGGRTFTKRVFAGSGYLCQSSKRLLFALGEVERCDEVRVTWPDGKSESWKDLGLGSLHRLEQGRAAPLASIPARARSEWSEPAGGAPLGRASRVVLVERLPMAPFSVPGFDWPARKVRDLAGKGLLLFAFSSQEPRGQEQLRRIVSRGGELAAANTRLVPLAVDEGPPLARSRALLNGLSLANEAGFLDARAKQAFELATLEVLGPFERVPLPCAWLLDAAGQLCALYVGPSGVDEMVADAQVLSTMPTDRGSTIKLEGGLWLFPRQRDFKLLGEVYRHAGFDEHAAWFESWAAKRAKGTEAPK
jgi:hypothetical protein